MTAKTATTRNERIAALAHRIWEEEGRPTGRDKQHWLRAAGIVDAELAKPDAAPRTRAPTKKTLGKKARKT
jgi:DUF2934 family protein